jgi:hypothetical protein
MQYLIPSTVLAGTAIFCWFDRSGTADAASNHHLTAIVSIVGAVVGAVLFWLSRRRHQSSKLRHRS